MVELLVVVLVIGILAAIALPAFLSQRETAQDAEAKAQVRDIQRIIEECNLDKKNYSGCDTASDLEDAEGMSFGTGPGQVGVLASSTAYIAWAVSDAKSGSSYHAYVVYRESPTLLSRLCSSGSGNTAGGCDSGAW